MKTAREREVSFTEQQWDDGSLPNRETSGRTYSQQQKKKKSTQSPISSKTITIEGELKTFPGLSSPRRSVAGRPALQKILEEILPGEKK